MYIIETLYFCFRSVEIKKNAVGPDHPTIALAMINMGTVQSLQNNYEKSKEYNMEAARIYEVLEWVTAKWFSYYCMWPSF